ncbi:MAG: ABC transporter substrate-binding protein [Alphaproteobacteria bacterium]|nr:ABC transporter substrate-binding protein [Alphaproteobacteria bacterium]
MKSRLLVASLVAAALAVPVAAPAQTLIVAAVKTPGGVDGDALKPATQNVVTQVYEGLTAYPRAVDAEGNGRLDFARVVPHLAEGWTVTPDGKTYVFKLRAGVRSPYGNEMTADDVVWSWEKSFAQKRTGLFIAQVSGVTKVEKVDKYEVRFTLSAPSQIFLHAITNYVPAIYDSTEVRKHATADDPWAFKWIDQNTAGFGAYHMESNRSGEQAVFIANPNYFGAAPHYKRVVYREIPSAASRFQLLVTGQVQWIEELTHKQIADLRKDRRVKVASAEGTAMASVRMNTRFKPFDDVRVRRAMQLATDYDGINAAVFEGLGTRPRSIVPPIIPGHLAALPLVEPNAERAKALLAEAGFPNGIDVTLEYAGLEWWEEGIAIQMQRSLGAAGIRATPKRITDADMRARSAINKRDLPLFTYKDFPFVLDPIYKMFNDAHQKGAANRNDYNNAEFDKLLDDAAVEIDPARRLAMAARAQTLHAEDATWIYITYPGHFEPMPVCMRGYTWYPDYHERWRELSCQ